jgi:hypothetical protein
MKKQIAFVVMLVSVLCLNVSAFAKDTQTSTTDSNTTQVKSYTKKDGTVVKGYTRTKKTKTADDTQQVKGYTKKDGTVVAGYTKKKAAKSTSK